VSKVSVLLRQLDSHAFTPTPIGLKGQLTMNETFLSFGGGVNSTAMILGFYEKHGTAGLHFNVLFSDTGGEKPETYRHVETVRDWLKGKGHYGIHIVREDRWTLEQDCINNHTLPSIVTGMRSCSDKFKIRPQDRFIAQWPLAKQAWERGEKVVKLVGFDAGEPWRAKDHDSKRYSVRYPLIEWGWDREDCIATIERNGFSVPPKSSCFFCPEMSEVEILQLQEDNPELLERALEMERNNTALHSVKGLARTHSWQQVVDYHQRQQTLPILPARTERKPCVCFDGE
jgi:hypothetical protein